MKIKIDRETILVIWSFLVTISGSVFCNKKGITPYIEYFAYGLLIISIVLYFVQKKINVGVNAIAVLFFICFGIILQDLTVYRRMVLCFTMFVLWITVYLAEGYLDSIITMRKISYSVFFGILVSAIFTIVGDYPLIDKLDNNMSSWGFNGGILYKNYFAADIIVIFIGLYLYRKYVKKKQIDFLVQVIAIVFLFVSFSKGAWIMFLIFITVMNYKYIKLIKRKQRKCFISVVAVLFIVLFVVSFKSIALRSETYLYRIRGWLNYIAYYRGDTFHLFFGSAENVYDKSHDYVYMVRATTGWDGSLEFAWLNILIKSGIIGIIGFGIIILHYLKMGIKVKGLDEKAIFLSIFIMLVISSLVEIYIQSVHNLLGIYCFMVLSGFVKKRMIKGNMT